MLTEIQWLSNRFEGSEQDVYFGPIVVDYSKAVCLRDSALRVARLWHLPGAIQGEGKVRPVAQGLAECLWGQGQGAQFFAHLPTNGAR